MSSAVRLDNPSPTAAVADPGRLGIAGQTIPRLGKYRAHGLGDPVHLEPIGGRDRHDHNAEDTLGVRLRVRESERGPPGDTVDQPPIDPKVLAQLLDVADQAGGRVRTKVVARGGDMRCRPAAPALVETDDPEP